MVEITERLSVIKEMVDKGAYFVINRARQYGKTTTIRALEGYLKKDYIVISLDFQRIGHEEFEAADVFCRAFASHIVRTVTNRKCPMTGLNDEIIERLKSVAEGQVAISLRKLFDILNDLCETAEKPIVLLIDEVDSATNNQVFFDFLAQLRADYLDRGRISAFQSVILAGVTDIKNLKNRVRPGEAHKTNSPWNIAADFDVDMSLSKKGIEDMLAKYKAERGIEMDESKIAGLIYDYTSGYPYLVSYICKFLDESNHASSDAVWSSNGVLTAVKKMLMVKMPLFDSMMRQLNEHSELKSMLYVILFEGKKISYSLDNAVIDMAAMYGYIIVDHGNVKVANRIFETRLYNLFLSEEELSSAIYDRSQENQSQFLTDNRLDMERVLTKFVEYFRDIYGENDDKFIEEQGRKLFLLYLKPIINGIGNYYIEAQTRDRRRTDVIVDYQGEQFIIELKIWHGNEYHERGEQQISEYLDYYHQDKGYLISFNFNKNKKVGVNTIVSRGKTIVEAVV